MNKEIKKLDLLCNQKIDLFIDHFKCNLLDRGSKFVGTCPVHGGDNRTAFNYYKKGYWKCRTHNCHEEYLGTPIGFIRGMMSRDQSGPVPFGRAINFICRALDTDFKNLPEVKEPEYSTSTREINTEILPQQEFFRKLVIPCPIFSKKFDRTIIQHQMIGLCNSSGDPMNKRSVVPVFNRDRSKIVAYQGRSIYGECANCNSYHAPGKCPEYFYPKWKAQRGFATDMTLYNYWQAKKAAQKSKIIFLTESVGNVLRLMEFDIWNCVANFGTNISEFHKEMLDNCGVERVIYIRDGGEAGLLASERARKVIGDVCEVPNFNLEDDIAAVKKSIFENTILKRLEEYK